MSDKYLLKVSIGPVQEFIAEARKTRDLWVGSYLLSYMTFKAIEPFIDNNCEIIYPYVEDSPFYKLKIGQEHIIPLHILQISSLPSHFLVVVPKDNLDNLIKSSRKNCKRYWLDISDKVKKRIHNEFNRIQNLIGWVGNNWDSLWDTQVEDLWYYLWVAIPVSDDELSNNYQEKARKIQRFLEERKITRTFNQWQGSSAIKCTQCGHREVMGPESLKENVQFWREVQIKFKANIREGDRLCAICIIKRFIKSSDILSGLSEIRFESTEDIAVIPFREYIKEKWNDQKKSELLEKANNLRKLLIPLLPSLTNLEDIESKLIYTDELSPDKLMREYFPELKKDTDEYINQKSLLEPSAKELREFLEKIYEEIGNKPSKYYAVLYTDGDDMGKWMSGALPRDGSIPFTKDEHKKRSKRLGELGNKIVPDIVKNFNSYTIYSGGDDMLALVPLDYVFKLAIKLRNEFSNKGMHPEATVSAGIVIAHYTENFRKVFMDGRNSLERAKKLFKGDKSKDSFFITLILSSGTIVSGGYKWFIDDDISVLKDVVGKLIEWMKRELLSPRFIYDVLECLENFYYEDRRGGIKFDSNLFEVEVERLFKRHSQSIPEDEIKKIVKYLSEIGKDDSQKDFDIKENLAGLLRITTFIARELILWA